MLFHFYYYYYYINNKFFEYNFNYFSGEVSLVSMLSFMISPPDNQNNKYVKK